MIEDIAQRLIAKQSTRLAIAAQKAEDESALIQPAFYQGYDTVTGTAIATVMGKPSANKFRVITNAPISTGDRMAMRPSGALDRLDSLNVRRKQVEDVRGVNKQKLILLGSATEFDYAGGVAISFDQILFRGAVAAVIYRKPIRSNFQLSFEYQFLNDSGNGLAVALTKDKTLDPNAGISALGIREFPVILQNGEFATGFDSFNNYDFNTTTQRPRLFILVKYDGRILPNGIFPTFVDIPDYFSPEATQLTGAVGESVPFKPALVRYENGIITTTFAGVTLGGTVVGTPNEPLYLRISTGSSFGNFPGFIAIRNVLLTKI